ncbi:unnamed protein product [Dibothriocephalus latus]|uniref:RRM domain-containing protein n=1 Tax=Dibothriocephalus latus TaxID=60516 RepID=A0A3P7QXS3_DIBLA|nr:unnamed protein product [Dibothriocephalus latus]
MPEATATSDLNDYFSQFGLIADVQLLKNKRKADSCHAAIVTFCEADAVRKVFAAQPHLLNAKQITVYPANKNKTQFIKPEVLPEKGVNPKGIFVGDLPETTRDCDLHEYFSKFGLITDVILLNKKHDGDSCRCGLVNFLEADAVKRVFAAQPHQLNTKQITVAPAKNKNADGRKYVFPIV